MEEQQHSYDWQLPTYKPVHVGTNLGYRSQLAVTPRVFPNQPSQLNEQLLSRCQKYHSLDKSFLQHLNQLSCVYRKFQEANFYESRELNHNYLQIGMTRMNTRAIYNRKLEGTEAYIEKSSVQFDSSFQSGNLLEAYEVSDNVFHLVLQNDTESLGFNSWFNFKVQNMLNIAKTYTFSIVNMRKLSYLYRSGMLPMVFRKDKGWHRGGTRVRYFKNGLTRHVHPRQYVTLEWQYTLNPLEEVQFASSIPYTVSDHHAFLSSVRPLTKHVKLTRETLSYSYLNNRIEILTITDTNEEVNKTEVMLMARVHPEEAVGSYIMEAIIKLLLSDGNQTRQLLKNYKFHIVPMVNPDGVVLGNSRCGALGKDLNRMWTNPELDTDPEIFELKKYIKGSKKISMIVDFHSQVKKKGCYVYGVHSVQHPYMTRELPFVLSELNPDVFSFRDSNFYCGMDKIHTARNVIWQKFRIPVYSYECSVCSVKGAHFGVNSYWNIAKDFLRAMLILSTNNEPEYRQFFTKMKKANWKEHKQVIMMRLKTKEENYEIGLRNRYEDSDTEPEDDYAIISTNKRPNASMSIEQLSQKLKIEANLEQLVKFKCRQFANIIPDKFRIEAKLPKAKNSSYDYQKRVEQLQKPMNRRYRNSPLQSTPEKPRSVKYKKLELPSDVYAPALLYTEMDSERDRIRSIINQSRSEHKKLIGYRVQKRLRGQHSMTLDQKHRQERILTLPDDMQKGSMARIKKRKSNLMDAVNVSRLRTDNILLSEFLDRQPLG